MLPDVTHVTHQFGGLNSHINTLTQTLPFSFKMKEKMKYSCTKLTLHLSNKNICSLFATMLDLFSRVFRWCTKYTHGCTWINLMKPSSMSIKYHAWIEISLALKASLSLRSGVINSSNKQKMPSALTDVINSHTLSTENVISHLTDYTKALCNQFAIIPLLRSTIWLTNYFWNMYSR